VRRRPCLASRVSKVLCLIRSKGNVPRHSPIEVWRRPRQRRPTSWLACAKLSRCCWPPSVGGGVRKSEGIPEHASYERRCTIHESQGDRESPKVCTRLKSCELLYTCPCAPFYRETKGLLHSENTLKSREYS
jgi:hypothetical protein